MSSRDLRIIEWEAKGLRCPDHRISFAHPSGSTVWPCTLIQMPNGTGKTTTLQLIRAALSGANDGREWTTEDVRAMAKRDADNDDGLFRISVLHDNRRCTITMGFDFVEGTVSYSTTHPSGLKRGFSPPSSLRRFLRPEIIAFLVFDGELAQHLINRQYNNAQLVIDGMFQVHAVDRLLKHVEGYWEAKTSKVTATKTKGLSRRRNKVRKLKELIAKRERVQRNVEAKYQSVHERLVEKEARFRDALATRENHLGRVQYAEKEHSEALEEKGQVIGEIVQVIKNPCSFSPYVAATLGALKLGLDEAKLPESAAREFFTELSRQMLCVCGRPLNFETRRAIRDRSSEYLGSEDVALLNAMKAAIGDAMECNPPHDAILSTLTIGLAEPVNDFETLGESV